MHQTQYKFTDKKDGVYFELHHNPPKNQRQYKAPALNKINLHALTLFGLYRSTVYQSYGTKPDLAEDIKAFNLTHQQASNEVYIDSSDALNSYAIFASLQGVKKLTEKDTKHFVAYQEIAAGQTEKLGFASFYESTVNNHPVVYIAEAGVKKSTLGQSIGRRLIECILSHYPANTEFMILTRKFNTEAKTLYQDRLKFTPITLKEIKQLDYDERYIGFKHSTTQLETQEILKRKQPLTQQHQTKKKIRIA